MLGAHKLYPQATPVLPPTLHGTVREFITLYKNGLPFVAWDDFRPQEPVTRLILTDTQTYPSPRWLDDDTDVPTLIIEHHEQERPLKPNETWQGERIGAATTLTVEQIRAEDIHLGSLEATLMALGIYVDTGMLTYGKTTPRDLQAAAWLLEHGAVLDTVRRFSSHPLSQEQQTLFEQLLDQTETRRIQGYEVTVCRGRSDENIRGLNSVTERLRDILDADALFVVVAFPDYVQMVSRSTVDAVHVGEVAQHLGGGGHPRAAAAAIQKQHIDDVLQSLWAYLRENVQPAVRISDLMSHSAQTVQVDASVREIIPRLRRIGHEGYPVLSDSGRVVGLLTLRDADKALEHGLKEATVRDVMQGGNVTLSPDDSVSALEQTMVATDWGQIPIVGGDNQLIGIVTRTDLIKHWGRTHPASEPREPDINPQTVRDVLDRHNLALIETVAQQAQQNEVPVYLVGGVVRDLFLERRNLDIDFVVEGNAISFAESLKARYGGSIYSYRPFGTATWHLDEADADALGLPLDNLPDHLDFATARSEVYEHPTALPTVYSSGIKLDLRRRDFTINTLAVQLSPERRMWRLLDFYGGMADLREGVIRVLHSLSFVDDPTRILRAVRFSERLQFRIEPRTDELIQAALPMLRRITGERVKNELNLLMNEKFPERAFLTLHEMGAPPQIHPAFQIDPAVEDVFLRERQSRPRREKSVVVLRWHLLLAPLTPEAIEQLSKRMHISQNDTADLIATVRLVNQPESLTDPDAQPAAIDKRLSDLNDTTLEAAWLWLADTPLAQERIDRYCTEWRHVKPTVTGHTLRARGLLPGPQYREILTALRDAWLNEAITSEAEEEALLQQLLDEAQTDEADA
jgi:tRNA nucleotidyltransferase (CCA-adding enzyme)